MNSEVIRGIKILGIIGDPVHHSLSPSMHNASLEKNSLPFVYLKFHIIPVELRKFVKKFREDEDMIGFNATIPHKEKIIPFLDEISPEARTIGAVNTVVKTKRGLKGYNTDAQGYWTSLTTETRLTQKRRAVVLGAGGAARAVIYALASHSFREIIILNRTKARALALKKFFQRAFPRTKFIADSLSNETTRHYFPSTDLLVNSTSIGLKATSFDFSLEPLPGHTVVSDLVYRPEITPLLSAARRRKLKIHGGLGMLLHQGALAYRIWTKKNPSLNTMRKALLDALDRS